MEKLYESLQQVAETFKDAVPGSYTGLPVIRYSQVTEVPSLAGDDNNQEWTQFYQVDVYQRQDQESLKQEIKDLCKENFWRITNIQDTEEDNLKRLIFDIKIEE